MVYTPKVLIVAHYRGMDLPVRPLSLVLERVGWKVDWFFSDNPDGHTDDPSFLRSMASSGDYDFVVTANSSVLPFVADPSRRAILVNHGPVPHKNHRAVQSVFAVVSTPYSARLYRELGQAAAEWWEDGYLEFDTQPRFLDRGEVGRIIYAPTFHYGFCGDTRTQLEIVNLLRAFDGEFDDKWEVHFCPHPITLHANPVLEFSNKVLKNLSKFGIMSHIVHGRSAVRKPIVITDYSAAVPLSFPWARVITYNSFNWWHEAEAFSTCDPVLKMRDACYQFTSPEALPMLLVSLIGHDDDPLARRREEWSSILYGGTLDGRVAERVAARMLQEVRRRVPGEYRHHSFPDQVIN